MRFIGFGGTDLHIVDLTTSINYWSPGPRPYPYDTPKMNAAINIPLSSPFSSPGLDVPEVPEEHFSPTQEHKKFQDVKVLHSSINLIGHH
ncbi:hypothetical protein NECAME_06983 [Necator americanus]|uniref:Uncharacterized protein n=1 Tax=Necator americanus TaxID=51031 RepID=W2TRE8_NECAM|nr:hypothetical protein NECAME_06983 [Necator americanus]ETN84239.1 hypothetical protein NECAME_06983 [Necator americanus]